MKKLQKFLVDLFFPIQCLGCDEEGEWLCPVCLQKIKINFDDNFHQFNGLNGVWVVTDYKQSLLSKVLHSFKYNFVFNLSQILGELLIKFLTRKIKDNKFTPPDLVVAVPLSRKRQLWRGFNQAELLAREVSQKFNWSLDVNLIARQYHTHPQVGLKAHERLLNVRGIFKITDYKKIINKKILLIDDVITTGATMQECATALKEAGAKEVWGLVIAKG